MDRACQICLALTSVNIDVKTLFTHLLNTYYCDHMVDYGIYGRADEAGNDSYSKKF